MPSTMMLFSIPSSWSFLIFLIVNSETIYCPNSALKFLAVSLEPSPLFLASSRTISPILTIIAPLSVAISETKAFPEPGIPDIPIILIIFTL